MTGLKHQEQMVTMVVYKIYVQGGCQPLFLGCDVLSGLSVSAKNRCRVHARFAKQGLATKLEFSGKHLFICLFSEIKTKCSLYYYNNI